MIGFGGVPSVARIPSNHGANSICDLETFRDQGKTAYMWWGIANHYGASYPAGLGCTCFRALICLQTSHSRAASSKRPSILKAFPKT
jgi:hypothetical protein